MTTTDISTNYEQALLQVATLASVKPTTEDTASLHDGLVLQALEKSSRPMAPELIREAIRVATGVVLTIEAVVDAVTRLLDEDELLRCRNFDVALKPEKAKELASQADSFMKLRQSVVNDWLDKTNSHECAHDGHGLSTVERFHLAEDLNIFLLQLVRYHGAEIALYLYPDAVESQSILNIDQKELFSALQRRSDRIQELRQQVLPAFVREAGADRAKYVAALLHRAALVQVLQVDPTAAAVFSEVAASKVLFLDTNFVFRLLGLQGEQLKTSAREVLDLGRQLGHTFRISTRTYEELQGIVQRQADWLSTHGDIPEPLAQDAADFVAGNDYVSAYWRNRSKYSDVSQFQRAYSHLSLLLDNLDVEIHKELVAEIANSNELHTAVNDLRVLKSNDSERVIEHDALHKTLIERLRVDDLGRQPEGWHDARFIFLTFDNKLPIFAIRAAQQNRGQRVPFCIMGHEWLQLLYFVLPQESITAEAFVSLVNSPYLETYFSQRAVHRDIVHEVVATMGEMRELRPAVAQRLLADRVLTNRLVAEGNPKDRDALIRQSVRLQRDVENERMLELLRNRDQEVRELKAELTETQTEKRTLEKRVGVQSVERKRAKEKTRSGETGELRKQVKSQNAKIKRLEKLNAASSEKLSAQEIAIGHLQKHARWRLVVPALLVGHAVREFMAGGLCNPTCNPVAWVALVVGIAPVTSLIWSRVRGNEWQLVHRVAAIVAIVVFVWEYVPGVRTAVRRTLSSLGWQ